ncbi:hypothetical protein KSP40_PGU022037 [Platanthera guangdongensis]|uniref:Uncharacterized protein n=1 Tax=Platanthera guangdongensis TaxID=2320717 RepID=A0ABR2M1Z0_9ASPA
MLDAQADVPLASWPQAQLAFKYSMVHGILQFAPRIAFRCALHRCEREPRYPLPRVLKLLKRKQQIHKTNRFEIIC